MKFIANSSRAARKMFALGLLAAAATFASATQANAQTAPCVPVSHAPGA